MIGDRNDIFECIECRNRASRQEIESRTFWRGSCGKCGGRMVPKANLDRALDVLARGHQLYRKATGR